MGYAERANPNSVYNANKAEMPRGLNSLMKLHECIGIEEAKPLTLKQKVKRLFKCS